MAKIDFKKTLADLYNPPQTGFVTVAVPPLNYLMVDGHGDPNVAVAYEEAVQALYALAYRLKFMSKQALARDYVVPPLEGLWWAEDMDHYTVKRDKSKWTWTMMIMTPEWIDEGMFATAVAEVRSKKNPPALPKLRLELLEEGLDDVSIARQAANL